jgi:hypothetical protein
MTNRQRLFGPYAKLLLLWIMGRISHFTLWNLLMHTGHPYTESTPDPSECPSTGNDTVIVNPQELLGHTFLINTQEDGQRFRARIVECISDHESNVRRSDDHVKF